MIKHIPHRALRALATGALLTLAAAVPITRAATELLTNGGFENGPTKATPYTVAGWTTTIDGSYWVLSTDISPAPTGSFSSPTYVGEGDYAIRRIIYSGQKADTSVSFNSTIYTLASLPETVSIGDSLLFSVLARPQGQGGRYEAFGAITFYSDAGGTVPIGSRYETDRVLSVSSVTIPYSSVSTTVVVPEGAAYFRVFGITEFLQDMSANSYTSFDSFSLTLVAIPEPQTAALVAGMASVGLCLVRRRAGRKQ